MFTEIEQHMPFSVVGGASEIRIAFLPVNCMSVRWNILSLPLTSTRGRIEICGLSESQRKRPPPRDTRLEWFSQPIEYKKTELFQIGIIRSRREIELTLCNFKLT